MGEYRRALEFAAANIALLQEDRLAERYGGAGLPAADSRTISAVCLAELGEFAAGAALGEEGIRIAETAAQPFSLTFAYARVGRLANGVRAGTNQAAQNHRRRQAMRLIATPGLDGPIEP